MPDSLSFDASFWEKPRPVARPGRTLPAELTVPVVYEDEAILVVAAYEPVKTRTDRAASRSSDFCAPAGPAASAFPVASATAGTLDFVRISHRGSGSSRKVMIQSYDPKH